jgi:hypothetical protein
MNKTPNDEQLLDRDNIEGQWERAPVDQQWWSVQSLPFPPPPIKAADLLIPISSAEELIKEHQDFGIPLDNFWMRSVVSPSWESAYFFKWCGPVPAIVLTIFGNHHLARVECLGRGDQPMPNRSEIVANVIQAFAAAGFEVREAWSKEN